MGWVPLNAVVVNVVIDEQVHACRLADRRDYAGLVEFLHRTEAISKRQEYSFISEFVHHANDAVDLHFIHADSGFIVNSSATLAYAIETHTGKSLAILLKAVKAATKSKHAVLINSNEPKTNKCDKHIWHRTSSQYVPTDRILPDHQSPMSELQREYHNRIVETGTVPAAGSQPTLRVNMFRGENSPATSANIGGVTCHQNPSQKFPDEAFTRAGDNLLLKAYGSQQNSRQIRNR